MIRQMKSLGVMVKVTPFWPRCHKFKLEK
uniref:Uncharacterized protein n=1 Tax=Rhizophora mucronata TaxID=61149 RepID=A0A2P2R4I8_RHIMU